MAVLYSSAVPLMFVAVVGCGGASFLLESPIRDQCESAGLKGCESITKGVLLVVEGDKAKGLKRVASGAAENAPQQLAQFAEGLRALKSIPGVSKYMGPIAEIADYLDKPGGDSGNAAAGDTREFGGTGRKDFDDTSERAATVITSRPRAAAADVVSRNFGGVIVPSDSKTTGPCGQLNTGGSCAMVMGGPLIITTVIRTQPSCTGLFLATTDSINSDLVPAWRLDLTRDFDEVRLFVDTGDTLYAGITAPDENCGVLWFGYRPYTTE